MSRWYTLSVLAALLAASPAMAANDRAASPPNPSPAVASTAGKPVLTAQAPFDQVWNSTLLSANSQAMGLQSSATNNHVRWTIGGAAIGAVIGAISGDALTGAAIGAGVGFAGSYVVHK